MEDNKNNLKKFHERKLIGKFDIAVIVGLVLISGVFYVIYRHFYDYEDVNAVICVDGEEVSRVPLDEDREFVFDEEKGVVFEVKGGKIRFLNSGCPDKICVKTGFISKGGQNAVCLPNRIEIKIKKDTKDDEIDGISR